MDIVQQQMLDSYRAARHGEAPPPLPGRHDLEVLRGLRDRLRAQATAFAPPPRRPPHGRGRAAG
ncbi:MULTISPECIES: hypothetical protein [Streptomyces]|uniref:Uncharacterized protein n=1 Tax=Streptomyces flavovirens TaxID=52258 RepID=A0ABV8N344_9ACTN|nr:MULTISPECIES: hypothetical protein [unclassified Streptomyces]MBK3591639.1 hypothetical protein [Streptomyces sp. MBT51]